MITGVRGLCNGLGPALYGLIFYFFHVDLNGKSVNSGASTPLKNETRVEDQAVLRVSL